MARPIIGILTNSHMINDTYEVYGSGSINVEAVGDVCNALLLLIPTSHKHVKIEDLIERCGGFVFTGARPNVHPDEYGEEATLAYGDFDRDRDGIALPLIRACVQRGLPIFGICRGFQEVNVAMGGSLHQRVHEVEGMQDHREDTSAPMDVQYGLSHRISLQAGGILADLHGDHQPMVNSVHCLLYTSDAADE